MCTLLQAISLLHQIVLQAPHLADAYHTLGLVYNSMGDKDRALGFSMLAAHLMPKDSSLWKLLVSWSTYDFIQFVLFVKLVWALFTLSVTSDL